MSSQDTLFAVLHRAQMRLPSGSHYLPDMSNQYRSVMSTFASASTGMESDEMTDTVHQFYNDPQADITLRSSDKVLFRVHSVLLRLASDVFAGMVSMPQSQTGSPEVVQVTEDSDVIRALLDIIYPRRPPPKMLTFAHVSRLAEAADKYDIVDASNLIRGKMSSGVSALPGSALEQYSLACRLDWTTEARYISKYTTPPNAQNSVERAVLETLDVVSMIKLINLHQRRHSMISSLVISYHTNVPEETRQSQLHWEDLASDHRITCRSQAHDRTAWTAFKLVALLELEKMTPATSYLGFRPGFWDDNRLSGLWDDKCSKCSLKFFQKDSFSTEFERVLRLLPTTIE